MMSSTSGYEFNFDGLVGPTHNYAGLAKGNLASQANAGLTSNPKQAAKQGLAKMHLLWQMGIPQAVMPPHQRPNIELLRILGSDGAAAAYSAASMWTANMATVSPSCDTLDHKLHITPANLRSNIHRAQEAEFSYKLLQKIFPDRNLFKIHEPLNPQHELGDEGAANHSVLCKSYGLPGLELFVYGIDGKRFQARQTKEACLKNIENHKLLANNYLLLQQNPAAIDLGVFHNDVVFVANQNVLLYHAQAFVAWEKARKVIENHFAGDCYLLEISDTQLSLTEAVKTYLFNSQIVSLSDKSMALIAPLQCQNSVAAKAVIDNILEADNPISSVYYLDLLQSMRNGGGPACLRLRVILTSEQIKAMHQNIIFNADLYSSLDAWIDKHYRDRLSLSDLADPMLVDEVFVALDELTQLLDLGAIYPFQQQA